MHGTQFPIPQVEGHSAFDIAFDQEQARSEALRTGLAIAFLISCLFVLLISQFVPRFMPPDAHARLARAFPGLVGALSAAVLLEGAWWAAIRVRRRDLRMGSFAVIRNLAEVLLVALLLLACRPVLDTPTLANSNPTLLYFGLIILAILQLDWRWCLLTGVASAISYLAIAMALGSPGTPADELLLGSPAHLLVKAGLMAACGALAGFVSARICAQVRRGLLSHIERDRAVSIFGRHVSPSVAELLLQQPIELAGENRHVSVMFLDIRGFTLLSDRLAPHEVMALLNSLFPTMIEIVNFNQGIVNKFLGDGFMAVFGAPIEDSENARRAVAAAMAILDQVENFRFGKGETLRIGIGIHYGEAVAGNVGSPNRQEYTLIGGTVNLASRIEQENKARGSQLLVSQAIWDLVKKDGYAGEPLGPVLLRGHDEPVMLVRLR